MTEENVEIVRRALEAFNREGVEAAMQYFDTEVEWLGPPEWLEEHLYKGHDGIRRSALLWNESFEEFRIDPQKLIDAGDQVVALAYQRGRSKGSANWIASQIAYVWTVRNRLGVRVQVYFSWEQALKAVGLDE
jgi:ketosteroid isomerase-like protein